jgi:hypothetical protein
MFECFNSSVMILEIYSFNLGFCNLFINNLYFIMDSKLILRDLSNASTKSLGGSYIPTNNGA